MAATLQMLGWRPFFQQQLSAEECTSCYPARVAAVHRSRVELWSEVDECSIDTALFPEPGNIAVGDWVLLERGRPRPVRVLERQSLMSRKAAGSRVDRQLIAANIDTLFIVSSCNDEFKESRIERYLALAMEAGIMPVVVLTKADESDDPHDYRSRAARLHPGLLVESCDARMPEQLQPLRMWCGEGQTIALVGSSGVGKSTIINTLCGAELLTGEIRRQDAKGRHATTARSMHRLEDGGLLVDTPGMRELQLTECDDGLGDLFGDITELIGLCRFSDCGHGSEPGCAVQAALTAGQLDMRRWRSYQKLVREQQRNAETLAEQRQRFRKQGRLYRRIQDGTRRHKGK